jgi:hypothetical protein
MGPLRRRTYSRGRVRFARELGLNGLGLACLNQPVSVYKSKIRDPAAPLIFLPAAPGERHRLSSQSAAPSERPP